MSLRSITVHDADAEARSIPGVPYVPGDLIILRFSSYGTQLGRILREQRSGRFDVETWNIITRRWGRPCPRGRQQILGLAPPEYVHALGCYDSTI